MRDRQDGGLADARPGAATPEVTPSVRSSTLGLLALLVAGSLGSGCESDTQTSAVPGEGPGADSPEGCEDPEDCGRTGGRLLAEAEATPSSDPARFTQARAMLDYACVHEAPAGCLNLSLLHRSSRTPDEPVAAHTSAQRGCSLHEQAACVLVGLDEVYGHGGARRDLEAARARFARACDAGVGTGCGYLGALLLEGALDGGADPEAALASFERGCGLDDGRSCYNAGATHYGGLATAPDLEAARAYMAKACRLGEGTGAGTGGQSDACEASVTLELEIAKRDSKISDANLHLGEASVDGLTVAGLECRVEGDGGLLGSLAIIRALAEHKPEIDRCGEIEARVEVVWRAEGGRITHADGDGAAAQCVARAIEGTVIPFDGECAVTVLLGL